VGRRNLTVRVLSGALLLSADFASAAQQDQIKEKLQSQAKDQKRINLS
jgi:hypothetical protein